MEVNSGPAAKQTFHLPPLNLRVILMALLLLVGLVPLMAKDAILTRTMRQSLIEDRQAEIQNRSLIFASRLTRSGYLKNTVERDSALNTEMDTVASIYNGRLLLVDSSYRIVRDSFHLSEGRFHLAPEVIRTFRGDTVSSYSQEDHYLVMTTPVYDSIVNDQESQNRTVEGALLFITSTEDLREQLSGVQNSLYVFDGVMLFLLLALSFFASWLIMKPFHELRASVSKVSNGDLNQSISQNTYQVTARISDSLNETLRRLKALDQSRTDFVSNVSHELKTPITSIRVLADSLLSMEDAPVEMYREFMNDISREIDREAKIIDDLLSLVRMDRQGEEQLNRKNTDINEMLEQILKRLRPIARLNNIELTLETVRGVTADVDEVKFSLAITNLVENAIKYNVKDGWVHVSLDADHQFCYIRIEDSGIGIPEDQQAFVFDRFFRVDKARSRETGGTGLGLAITREIILLHQGIIKLTSSEGKGSTFLVRIPLNYIENTRPAGQRAGQQGQSGGQNSGTETPGGGAP